VKRYSDAFGVSIETATEQEVWRLTGRALRAFLTKAVSRDAPFDRWNAGDDSAMSEKQKRGYALFEGKARCGACHSGPLFSDFSFHNVSTSPPDSNGSRADEGRYLVTKDPKDRGKFLTPTLRGVSSTLPYFHDGSQAALPNVVRFFASFAVEKDPLRDPAFQSSLALTDDEVSEIVAFLGALQGDDVAATIQPPK
jgi:cytochrome c peroxidase